MLLSAKLISLSRLKPITPRPRQRYLESKKLAEGEGVTQDMDGHVQEVLKSGSATIPLGKQSLPENT